MKVVFCAVFFAWGVLIDAFAGEFVEGAERFHCQAVKNSAVRVGWVGLELRWNREW